MPKVLKIYLLRHAKPDIQSSTVPTKNCGIITPSDQTLSRLVQQLPVNSRLIHSPLKRAVETLACLTKLGLKSSSIEENNSFSEQDLGFLEGTTYEDAWQNLSILKPHNWAFFPADYTPKGGESFTQVTERVVFSLNKIIREKLCIKTELSFLNTPRINKNMIDNEIKISGKTKCKFSIMVYKVGLNYMFQLNFLLTLQLYL